MDIRELIQSLLRAERAQSNVVTFLSDKAYLSEKGQDVTREILDAAEEQSSAKENPAAFTQADKRISTKVFVVHGHDLKALDETEILLRRWGLEPVILRDRASEGRTVIENRSEFGRRLWACSIDPGRRGLR